MENVYAFYKNATVLITGGTGFMGKVLVEKLLRCFDVKCIILLVRSKNNVESDVRLAEYIKESVSLLHFFLLLNSGRAIVIPLAIEFIVNLIIYFES
jgi:FlaA1/EpsC-like NDP-sugar epimerase